MAITIPKKVNEPAGRLPNRLSQTLQFLRQINLQPAKHKKVHPREVMFFSSQLSMMMEAGVPLNLSILAISSQVKNPHFKNILGGVVAHIEGGLHLSEALARFPEAFSQVYTNMIRAGETGGQLKEMLDRLVEFEKKRQRVLFALRSALAYPIFLVFLTGFAIIFILAYIFPKFGELFEEIRDQLPFTTKLLLLVSSFLRGYWPVLVLLITISGWVVWRLLSTQSGKAFFDRLTLTIPMVKGFLLKFYISNFMRTLGALIGGGVVLLDALRVSKGVVGSAVFARFMDTLMENVEEGKGLAHPIGAAPFMPPLVKQMIKTGEDTGNLPKVMGRIADYYDEEMERNLKIFTTILEPLLLVIMGAVVGIVVISLILPIFKLTRTIH